MNAGVIQKILTTPHIVRFMTEIIRNGNSESMGKNGMNKEWLIWSIEHCSWWKANQRGYTKIRDDAGLYTFEEASEIVRDANKHTGRDMPNEALVPLHDY